MWRKPSQRVQCKSVEQQDIQSLRRIRQRAVDSRMALGNQIRGFKGGYGLCFRQSPHYSPHTLYFSYTRNCFQFAFVLDAPVYSKHLYLVAPLLKITGNAIPNQSSSIRTSVLPEKNPNKPLYCSNHIYAGVPYVP